MSNLATENYDVPSIRLVNELIEKAVTLKASDIHLESCPEFLRVRLRIDGMLYDEPIIKRDHMSQVLNRIKILSQLDIAEKRIPQDGKLVYQAANIYVDVRISTFPTVYGEKIVIRILDRSSTLLTLDHLGLNEIMLAHLQRVMQRAQGFFLVTGPTGSGKTTTLYSVLAHLSAPETNITTLEDPIEYYVDGITQAQVHPGIGFTFARGIRSLLRQDPDVIMIGEIRDQETAQVSVQAALTGHLVLSTLHTSDAPSTIIRLLDMGIEPFLLNTTLTGILAQRLARKLCAGCKYQLPLTEEESRLIARYGLPIHHSFTARGCADCRFTGYRGRIGIFELLEVSHELRSLVTQRPVYASLKEQAQLDGMQTLLLDGAQKVNAGIMSMSELVRSIL